MWRSLRTSPHLNHLVSIKPNQHRSIPNHHNILNLPPCVPASHLHPKYNLPPILPFSSRFFHVNVRSWLVADLHLHTHPSLSTSTTPMSSTLVLKIAPNLPTRTPSLPSLLCRNAHLHLLAPPQEGSKPASLFTSQRHRDAGQMPVGAKNIAALGARYYY